MRIDCEITGDGLALGVDDRLFRVAYPGDVWRGFPHREAFAEHYAFLKALHLPQMLAREDEALVFATRRPLHHHAIFLAMLNNVPFCADVDGVPTGERLRALMGLELRFADDAQRLPVAGCALGERAVVNMSFGKDSLLSWALARDLGLDPLLWISVDNDCPREYAWKAGISARFCAEFGQPVHTVVNDTGLIHRPEYWQAAPTEWGFGHLITEYAMHALPFAWQHAARYVLLGNEKSCDDSYLNRDGFRAWPVYDQSSEWSLELTHIARGLIASPVTVCSLIEPLHDLAIIRILHRRYPQVAKYQMSCFPDESEHGRHAHWCGHCTKCARNFVFMRANGIEPRSVGLAVDMFGEDSIRCFPLIRDAATGVHTAGYDATPCGRDEQLLALLLARERGASGAVIERFEARFLAEATGRRAELEARFLRVQDSRTMPVALRERVMALCREALAPG